MALRFRSKQSKVLRFLQNLRFVVLVAGRRFGKTYLAVAALIICAAASSNLKVWYVAPTYKQAKEITWDILRSALPRDWIQKINETELRIVLKNGSSIALKGADNPDSLRGPGLDLLVIDEASIIKNLKNLWEAVLGPTLATTQGKAFFIGTPCGYDYFYKLYSKSISTGFEDSDKWAGFQWTSEEGGYIPDDELAMNRRTLDPRIFRQEYEASFETLAGRVYHAFDRDWNVTPDISDNHGDILCGIDFNVDPMSAVICQRAGRQLHILEDIEIQNSNTQEMAATIVEKYGSLRQGGRLIAFPDPSGRARKTSSNLGVTDLVILRNAGFDVVAPKRAPGVMDRVNTVNAMLCNAKGERNMLIHPRCQQLIECFEGLTYKEGTNQPNKEMGLDHLPDATGYLVWSEFPVLRPGARSGEI